VQKFCKSVKIWQNYGHESVAPFLAHPVGMWDRFESAPAPLQSPVRSVQFAGDDGAAGGRRYIGEARGYFCVEWRRRRLASAALWP